MKKLALCLATMIPALSPDVARAAVVFTFDPNANRVVNGNLATYTLSFTTTFPGAKIAGIAGNFAGNNAFNGPMMQQLAGGAPTPTKDSNASIDASLDTQFLVSNSEILSAVSPFESSTTLGGAFTLNVAARAQTKALVQVVADKDVKIFYDLVVSDAVFEGFDLFQGFLGVPEPSSLALASLLGLSAARRRTSLTQLIIGCRR